MCRGKGEAEGRYSDEHVCVCVCVCVNSVAVSDVSLTYGGVIVCCKDTARKLNCDSCVRGVGCGVCEECGMWGV